MKKYIYSFIILGFLVIGSTVYSATTLFVTGGGTGRATLGDAGVLIGNGAGAINVTSAGTSGQILTSNGAGVDPTFQAAATSGTVTSVSVVTANGLSGTVATATSTPAITLNITALDATKIADGSVTSTEFQYINTLSSNAQTQIDSKQATGNYITALTGDATATGPGSAALTLATVNSNVGSFGSATQVGGFTVNAKGLITAAADVTITPAVGSITGLGTGVATALGVNVGSAGAFVVNGGALGTPSSGTVTNLTGTAGINITGTAPAGTLTGTTLASNVVTSSLTTIGTLVGGAVPASLVTAGTFGTGAYVMDTSLTSPTLYGSSAANGDITIHGTSSATKTTSYVLLQPTSGNVGIGTTNPLAVLEVSRSNSDNTSLGGYTMRVVNTAGSGKSASMGFAGATNGAYIGYIDNTTAALQRFSIGVGADTEQFTVLQTGNVGIGVVVPEARLEALTTGANDTIAQFTKNNASDGGNNVIIQSARTASNAFNFLIAVADYDGTPAVKFQLSGAGEVTLAAPPTAGVGATYLCLSTGNVINSGATCAASTKKVKTNITSLSSSALFQVMGLNPVSFNYTKDYYGGKKDVGFIAEEVNKINPLLTIKAEADQTLTDGQKIKKGDPMALNVPAILSVVTEGVQEVNKQVQADKLRITSLEKENKALKIRLDALEKKIK